MKSYLFLFFIIFIVIFSAYSSSISSYFIVIHIIRLKLLYNVCYYWTCYLYTLNLQYREHSRAIKKFKNSPSICRNRVLSLIKFIRQALRPILRLKCYLYCWLLLMQFNFFVSFLAVSLPPVTGSMLYELFDEMENERNMAMVSMVDLVAMLAMDLYLSVILSLSKLCARSTVPTNSNVSNAMSKKKPLTSMVVYCVVRQSQLCLGRRRDRPWWCYSRRSARRPALVCQKLSCHRKQPCARRATWVYEPLALGATNMHNISYTTI